MPIASFNDMEIALKARRRLERPLMLAIWLGAAMLSVAEGNFFYLIASTFAAGVNLLAVHRTREVFVGKLFINIAVLLSTIVLLLELLSSRAMLPAALGHYIVLIQICKLFERKRNRDYVQMLALSMLTVVAAALFSQAIWFAVSLVIYISLVGYCAMALTIKRGLDSSAEARLANESSPLSARRIAWNVIRDWPTAALLQRLSAIVGVLMAMGVAVFFVAPRSDLRGAQSAMFGMTASEPLVGEVKLGQQKEIYLSDKVMMRLRVRDSGKVRFIGPLYLRGKAYELYNKSAWQNLMEATPPSPPVEPTEEVLSGAIEQEVAMSPLLLPQVFAVGSLVKLASDDSDCFINRYLEGLLSPRVLPNRPIRYRAYSLSGPLSPAQQDYLRDCQAREASFYWPEQTVDRLPKVEDLAKQWCQDLLNTPATSPSQRDEKNLAIARRISQRLRDQYEYTLDLSAAEPDRDGVEDFLFYMKRGHCEYFASAMTVMCRQLGVRARLVTGFLADEYDRAGDYYVVRQRDAHAWTEVFTPAAGWTTFDATTARRWTPKSADWLLRVDDFWGRVQFQWYNRVIGYDSAARRELWRQVTDLGAAVWNAVAGMARACGQSLVNLLVRGYVDAALVRMSLAAAVVAAVAEAMLIVRWRRRALRRLKELESLAASPWGELVFVPRLLDILRKKALPAGQEWTAMETARQAAGAMGLPVEALREMVKLYYQARWGRLRPPAPAVARAREQARRIAQKAHATGKTIRQLAI